MSAWLPDPLAACGFRWERDAELPGREPAVTMIPAEPVSGNEFTRDDGSVYTRIHPDLVGD